MASRLMRWLVVCVLCAGLAQTAFGGGFPRGSTISTVGGNALLDLVNSMPANSWKKMNTAEFPTYQAPNAPQYFDGGYQTATGSWSGSTITLSAPLSGIQVGYTVMGSGIPTYDWVTSISGTTIGLYASTSGGSGILQFAEHWPTSACGGGTDVWAFSHPAMRESPPQIMIEGGGHTDGCDSGVYYFDPASCAGDFEGGGSPGVHCGWTNPVKSARYILPFDYAGNFTRPSWSCEVHADFSVATAPSGFSGSASAIDVTLAAQSTRSGTIVQAGSFVWGPGIAYGTAVSSVTGSAPNFTLHLNTPTTGSVSAGSAVYFSDGTNSSTLFAINAATSQGATSITTATANGLDAGYVWGPTIEGSTVAGVANPPGFAGSIPVTDFHGNPQQIMLSQASGPVFLSTFLHSNGNGDGVQMPPAVHSYTYNFPIPGGPPYKWGAGMGDFTYPDISANSWANIWDSTNNTFGAVQGPPTCFGKYGLGAKVNPKDSKVYRMFAAQLHRWDNSFTTPSEIVAATGPDSGMNGNPRIIHTVMMADPFDATKQMFFVDDSSSTTNGFVAWLDPDGTPAGISGSFLTNPNTIFTVSTQNDGRGYCGQDGKIYAWEGNDTVAAITPGASDGTGWNIGFVHASVPPPSPALGTDGSTGIGLMCLGPTYSDAMIATAGGASGQFGEVWIYKP